MIEQERQASFKHGLFDISLRMSPENTLSITIENTDTLERSSQTIDREYISQQDNFFQTVFEGAHDVYDYLKAQIDGIIVEGESLLFDYKLRNNKKAIRISINLVREKVDRIELAHLKADKLKAQLHQKDIEIKELTQKYESLYQTLQRFSLEIQQMKGEILVEKAKSRDLEEQLRALIPLRPLIPIVQDLQKMPKLNIKEDKIIQNIDHHPDNSHKIYYTLTNVTETSALISRIGDNSKCYNFVNKCEILPNQKVEYSVTIKKTAGKHVLIGFCTEKGLGSIDFYKQAESAYYYCTGPLYQAGVAKGTGVVSGLGDTVKCVVDLTNFKLSWWKKESQIVECSVPAEMRNKNIYISIILYSSGDEVDLSI